MKITQYIHPHTKLKINYELEGKEFILQKFHNWYRCISWHPHYITTAWYDDKQLAINKADELIESYYQKEKYE